MQQPRANQRLRRFPGFFQRDSSHACCELQSEAIAFDGTLRMDATISQAAGGGFKGVLLKAIDPLFRKNGAGALVPIKVRGTREKPQFGLDIGKVFK